MCEEISFVRTDVRISKRMVCMNSGIINLYQYDKVKIEINQSVRG